MAVGERFPVVMGDQPYKAGKETSVKKLLETGPWISKSFPIVNCITNEDIENNIASKYDSMASCTVDTIGLNINAFNLSLSGGIWTTIISKITQDYGTILAYLYSDNSNSGTVKISSKYAGKYTRWKTFSTFNGSFTNAGSHNSIFRGAYLGSAVTDAQYAAIAAGTFDDLYIGDYWTIGGVNWRIAAFDYLLNCGDTSLTKHHAIIVPDTSLYSAKMNDTNTTEGGYAGSKMRTENLAQATTAIKAAFPDHVLKKRLYLTNAVTDGVAAGSAWFDSEVDLMCEHMVYGSGIFSPVSSGDRIPANYRVEKNQLPLFSYCPQLISNRGTFWLRDILSNHNFPFVYIQGAADCDSPVSSALGVRPYFLIG